MHAIVHPADIQDRDGGVFVMTTMFGLYPFLQKALRRRRISRSEVP